MAFGKNLKNFLDEKKVSVAEASKLTGISYSTLDSIIKRDSSNISVNVAIKIAKAFGVSIEEIDSTINQIPQSETEAEAVADRKRRELVADMSLLSSDEVEQIENMIRFFAKRRAGQSARK